MPDTTTNEQSEPKNFQKKVWIVGGIAALIIVGIPLINMWLRVLFLVFAGILVAIYFHGCADILKKYLHWPSKLSVVVSVIVNILLLVAFFWFVGARLQDQVAQLSDTLPETIQNAKEQLNQSVLGSKVVDLLNRSGSSKKTNDVVKQFFLPVLAFSVIFILSFFSLCFSPPDPLNIKKELFLCLLEKPNKK
jgi:predicted PurR-regulated permease PerM